MKKKHIKGTPRWRQVLIFLARLILGGIFIYASIDKVLHPQEFARIIYNYQMVPAIFINAMAVLLPWIELIAGFFLIVGIFIRTAAIFLTGLLGVFISVLAINSIRGLDISCGCFSVSQEGGSILTALIRDLFFLIPGIIIIIFHPYRLKGK